MSDAVTNAEVEDVLSSIRRLVSEDKRPLRSEDLVPANDRLVLTPSLRVSENAQHDHLDDTAPAAEHMTTENGLDQGRPSGSEFDFEEDPAFDFVAPQAQPETEGANGAEASLDAAEGSVEEDKLVLSQADREGGPALDAWSEAPNDTTQDAEQSDAEQHVEQGGATDPQQFEDSTAEDFSEETSASDLSHASEPEVQDWEADVWDDAEEHQSDDEDAALQDDTAPDQKSGDNVLSMSAASAALGASSGLSAKIAALETAIGGISDNFEPETAGEDIYSATDAPSMAWDDAGGDAQDGTSVATHAPSVSGANKAAAQAFDDATGFDAQEDVSPSIGQGIEDTMLDVVGAETSAAAAAAIAAQAPMIDEEVLRDMVSEIVRAELQGALGERITRNVRKLVRREIHRALTAQELE